MFFYEPIELNYIMKDKLKSISRFFDGAIFNFILFLIIVFGFGYAVYITVKFVLESNNLF